MSHFKLIKQIETIFEDDDIIVVSGDRFMLLMGTVTDSYFRSVAKN